MEQFNEDFVYELLYLSVKKKRFFDILNSVLKFKYLPDSDTKKIWRHIRTVYSKGKKPSWGVLYQGFRREREIMDLITDIKHIDPPDEEAVIEQLEDFIKMGMFVSSQNEVAELYNQGDFEKAFAKFAEVSAQFNDFSLQSKKFESIFEDFDSRQTERQIRKLEEEIRGNFIIPFGIDELDDHFRGIKNGDAMLITADSGVGKTFSLIHFAINAVRRGYNVVHFQAEGKKEEIEDRFDAAITGSLYTDIRDGSLDEEREEKIQKLLASKSRGEIFYECFERFNSANMAQIRQKLVELKKKHDIHIVTMDYLELIDPDDNTTYGQQNNERFRQTRTARLFKDLMVEQNTAGITATQSSSVSPENKNRPDFWLSRFHLSEDKGKVRPFDWHLTLNQTPDEKRNHVIRIFVDKAREYASGQKIKIATNLSRSRFYNKKKTLNRYYGELEAETEYEDDDDDE